MIHFSKVLWLMERRDGNNRRVPFSLQFVKAETGEVVTVKEAVCTSSYHAAGTCNIMLLPSMQVRKIRMLSIIQFNGAEVFV